MISESIRNRFNQLLIAVTLEDELTSAEELLRHELSERTDGYERRKKEYEKKKEQLDRILKALGRQHPAVNLDNIFGIIVSARRNMMRAPRQQSKLSQRSKFLASASIDSTFTAFTTAIDQAEKLSQFLKYTSYPTRLLGAPDCEQPPRESEGTEHLDRAVLQLSDAQEHFESAKRELQLAVEYLFESYPPKEPLLELALHLKKDSRLPTGAYRISRPYRLLQNTSEKLIAAGVPLLLTNKLLHAFSITHKQFQKLKGDVLVLPQKPVRSRRKAKKIASKY